MVVEANRTSGALITANMAKRAHDTPSRSGFCCYILQSECWPTPYTGKTCDLAGRLHRHNHPSRRSRAFTKGKGPWRVAAAVFGLRSNRQSVWLERALKRHAKHRARPLCLRASSREGGQERTPHGGREGNMPLGGRDRVGHPEHLRA